MDQWNPARPSASKRLDGPRRDRQTVLIVGVLWTAVGIIGTVVVVASRLETVGLVAGLIFSFIGVGLMVIGVATRWRAAGRSVWLGLAIALTACFAMLVVASPLLLFASMAGEPLGRGFVERRPDGLYAQLRACGNATVHTVHVSALDEPKRVPPFWSATASGPDGTPALKLFSLNPGLVIGRNSHALTTDTYGVLINKNQPSEAFVDVDLATLGVGEVAFGTVSPVSRAKYDRMPNTDFGCRR